QYQTTAYEFTPANTHPGVATIYQLHSEMYVTTTDGCIFMKTIV
ncbi:MAG: hypothetical protein UY16_C0070G0001, partial [Candidatus Gottesmanbacteria bacterium GW2011_GWA2_47_9]